MNAWISDLVALHRRGEPAVLVSVVSTRGSVPREAGTHMVVSGKGVAGTIGGGNLELQAIGIARDVLRGSGSGELRRFPLGASLGQCCGGLVNLLFEPVAAGAAWPNVLSELARAGTSFVVATTADQATRGKLLVTAEATTGTLGASALNVEIAVRSRAMLAEGGPAGLVRAVDGTQVFLDPVHESGFEIVLFGAGHVGRALVATLAGIDCHLTWIDSRDVEFPADIPRNVEVIVTDAPEAEVTRVRAGAYFLVMTHSHTLDQALAEAILRRGDLAYFGLIGSVSKRRQFERRMEARGIDTAQFAAMTCPIGIAGIRGKTPATIAIAVAAQLLQVRERALCAAQDPAAAGWQPGAARRERQ